MTDEKRRPCDPTVEPPAGTEAGLHEMAPASPALLADDVMSLLQPAEALRQSESRLRALLRAMPDLMFLQSADGVYLDYHARDAAELLVAPSEFIGRSMHDVLPPALADEFRQAFAKARQSGEEVVVEYFLSIGAGERAFEARIIASEDGTFLSIVRDVTERWTSAEALRVAQAEVARATRMVTMGELAASIVHEVSQPLTAIINNGRACQHWLAKGELGEVRAAIQDIIKDGNRAAAVMSRTRALVRKGAAEPRLLDVSEVVSGLLPLVRQELVRSGITLRHHLPAGLPRVSGDRILLEQVVLNLLMNAIEAVRPVTDRPRLLDVFASFAGRTGVMVTVCDNGVGIDPAHRDRLFEPFFTTKSEGLGMGLSVSRSIVESHGGRLTVASHDGPGATFTFTLPIARC